MTLATRWPWIIVAGLVAGGRRGCGTVVADAPQPAGLRRSRPSSDRRRSIPQRRLRPPSGRSNRTTTPRPSGRRRRCCSRSPAIARPHGSWTARAPPHPRSRAAFATRARRSRPAISRRRRAPPATCLTVDNGNAEARADHGAGRDQGRGAQCGRCEDPHDRRTRTGTRR